MRRGIAPALTTLVIVIGCVALGVWQLERREWKAGLVAAREAALAAAPVAPPRSAGEARVLDYRRVVAEGVFLNDKAVLLHAIGPKGAAGFAVLTPLRLAEGRIVIVNRGFVPNERRDPAIRPLGSVRVEGLLRLPPAEKPGWFTPDNRPAAGEWFWVDLGAIAAAQGLIGAAPFYLDTAGAPPPLPNDHLQYAITWFSLAAAALVIYVLSERRLSRGRDDSLPGT
jgi:surfeit locus 1 family protein